MLLNPVVVGDIFDFSEVHAAFIFTIYLEDGSSMYL
jgi:hypothetical protein